VTAPATRWTRLRSAWNRSQLSRICWLVVDPQVAIGEPSFDQRGPGPLGVVSVVQDGDPGG
jgi:hypothetical protein